MPYDEIKVPILPYIHLVAVLSPWVGSAIYHTFMNHHHGYRSVTRVDIVVLDTHTHTKTHFDLLNQFFVL